MAEDKSEIGEAEEEDGDKGDDAGEPANTPETADDSKDAGEAADDETADEPADEEWEEELTGATLLPRVQQLLTRIMDADERARFERFFTSAAVAIEGLGVLDLSGLEEAEVPESDVSYIELLPATARRALTRIERFLAAVKSEFPSSESDQEMDLDFELEASDEEASEAGEQDLGQALNAFVWNIGHEVRVLGDSLQAKVERKELWSVLERVGEFRGRTRSGIGEMFFLAAREHAVVRKEDVVPFYQEDVARSLALRGAITTLGARIDVHRTKTDKLREKKDDDALREALIGLHHAFDTFMQSEEYQALRVVDRRSCVDIREDLKGLTEMDKPKGRAIDQAIEGLTKFLDSLTLVNQRELLVVHDRKAAADTEAHLDAIGEAVATDDIEHAREALVRAIRTAEPLFGRDPTFDGLLKLLKHVDPKELTLDDALAMANLVRRQLNP